MEKPEKPISIRERAVFLLVIFLIRLINPWEYDHQFQEFWVELKRVLGGHEFSLPISKP